MFGLDTEEIEDIRNRSVKIHCHIVRLYQTNKKPYTFDGYGIIKSNDYGDLYLEFICTATNIEIPAPRKLPQDWLNEDEYLSMEAIGINGRVYKATGLPLSLPATTHPATPTDYVIHLKNVHIEEQVSDEFSHVFIKKNILRMEFHEKIDIPHNKSNTEESSLDGSSFSWNETCIENERYSLSIVDRKDYVECIASSDILVPKDLESAIIFYIGFTSGVFPQPYYSEYRNDLRIEMIIHSYGYHKTHLKIPPPTRSNCSDRDGNLIYEPHYDLFRQMQSLFENEESTFKSLFSNWSRVWHSYHNKERNVSLLTLTVSIEGILNDIFIPKLEEKNIDPSFSAEKQEIQNALKNAEGINTKHIDTLIKSVERWGNIYPKKGLLLLHSQYGFITKNEVDTWEKLRNKVAHPRTKLLNSAKQKKEETEYLRCLSLFYKLVLIRLKYEGAFFDFSASRDMVAFQYGHLNFFDN